MYRADGEQRCTAASVNPTAELLNIGSGSRETQAVLERRVQSCNFYYSVLE